MMKSVNLTLETMKQWWKNNYSCNKVIQYQVWQKKNQSLTDGEQIVTKLRESLCQIDLLEN